MMQRCTSLASLALLLAACPVGVLHPDAPADAGLDGASVGDGAIDAAARDSGPVDATGLDLLATDRAAPADTGNLDHAVATDAAPGIDRNAPDVYRFDANEDFHAGPFRVLFDNSTGEQAGNADWVIDDSGRYPAPADPSNETSWRGGISSWGFALHQSGRYQLETLPDTGRITFGDNGNAQDLSNYDVFVVCEPNNSFTAVEVTALLAYVQAGGGLFMVADHGGADRDNDGIDAVKAWNAIADNNQNPFGIRFNSNSWTQACSNLVDDPRSRVLHGPFGEVTSVTYYAGSSMTISPVANPTVRGLIFTNDQYGRQGDGYVVVAISSYGSGRVVAIGDSSPADDGTGRSGADLQDGWNDAAGTNAELFLNATAWLVHDGMSP